MYQVEILKDNEWCIPDSSEVGEVTQGYWSISDFEYRPNAKYVEACFHQYNIPARVRKVVV